MARFRNPALRHRTWQIAMDGTQKLPQRLLGTVRDRLAAGASIDRLALGVAAWMRYATGRDERGAPIDLRDPLADELRRRTAGARTPAALAEALFGLDAVFGRDLPADPRFTGAVTAALSGLLRDGAAATVARFGDRDETTMTARTLRLHPDDDVVVALDLLQPGDATAAGTAAARVPKGHKMATAPLPPGAPVRKFGQVIGFATQPIAPGDWVHEHNLAMGEDFARDYAFGEARRPDSPVPEAERATFRGFRRADGRAGTRNYLAILTSVNCSASVARFIAREVERSGVLARYPHVDGVIPLVHGTGCGMADRGEGFDALKRTQWGYATNPNIAGVLLVGLGCEVFQIGRMKSEYGLSEGDASAP